MNDRDPLAEAFQALRAATEAVDLPNGFVDRACAEAKRRSSPLGAALVRSGGWALVAGAVLAALLSTVAARSVGALQDQVRDRIVWSVQP